MRMSRRMGIYSGKSAPVYTWQKWNANNTIKTTGAQTTMIMSVMSTIVGYESVTIIGGKIVGVNQSNRDYFNFFSSPPNYVEYNGAVYKYISFNDNTGSFDVIITLGALAAETSKGTTSYGTVKSEDPNTYPTNGLHTDGYWYVLQ